MAASSIHVMRFSLPVLQLTACSTSAYLLPMLLVPLPGRVPRIPSVSLNDSGSSSEGTQAHRPEDGGQKPFMMMAPMFLPHCPGDEDQPCPTSQHPDRQLNGPLPPLPRMDPNDRVLDRLDAALTTAPRMDHQYVGNRCCASGIAGMTKLSSAQRHAHQNASRPVCQLHLFTVSLQLSARERGRLRLPTRNDA